MLLGAREAKLEGIDEELDKSVSLGMDMLVSEMPLGAWEG